MPHKLIETPFFRHVTEVLASIGIIFEVRSKHFDWFVSLSCVALNTLFFGYLLFCNMYFVDEAKKNTSENT